MVARPLSGAWTDRRSGRSGRVVLTGVVLLAAAAGVGAWWLMGGTPAADEPDGSSGHGGDEAAVWFQEVAEESGVRFTHFGAPVVRYWFPEIMGGGAALFDYDNDGDLDLYLVQGGDLDPAATDKPGNELYRNRGDGTFEAVTESAGVGDTGYGMGCSCGDYDGDGDVDLYVTNYGPNVLYRNNGDGTFTDVTSQAGVGDTGWSSSSAFVDYDQDGDLDLFVVNYISWFIETEIKCYAKSSIQDYCKPSNYDAPAPDTLYRNNGDGTFADVSEAAGLRAAFGNGLGVTCGDFNADGRMDLYVANDGMPNQLWINSGDGTFVDDALLAGCSVNRQGASEAGMGVASVDIENDGDLDLFMTHLRNETNTLYINEGGVFEDETTTSGLASVSVSYTGFGMGFADFDHDGELDLYIANGKVGRGAPELDPNNPYGEVNLLLRGRGHRRFDEVLPVGGTREPLIGTSRAAAFGDVDNDGDIDIVVMELGGPARLLRNVASTRGDWVMFRVVDKRGVDAVGAMVGIEAGGRRQVRQVQTAYSYCASNDPRVHFGLGHCKTVDHARVRWPDGHEESFGPYDADHVYQLREGSGTAAAPTQDLTDPA